MNIYYDPLLFLIYLMESHQIPLSSSSFMDIILYYDLLLYHFIHDHDQRDFIYLQVDIDKVSDWVDGNHLILNAAMSKLMQESALYTCGTFPGISCRRVAAR